MERLVLAVAIVALASAVAALLRRRRGTDPPVATGGQIPAQLDRADFDSDPDTDPDTAPWLVVVFTSERCQVCAGVFERASALRSDQVRVVDISYEQQRALQERYRIDSVPTLVIADRSGAVRYGHVGPVTATDLWAAMAEVREPGSVNFGGECRHPD